MIKINALALIIAASGLYSSCTKKDDAVSKEDLIETIEISDSEAEGSEELKELDLQEQTFPESTLKKSSETASHEEEKKEDETKSPKEPSETSVAAGETKKGKFFYEKGLKLITEKKVEEAKEAYLVSCQLEYANGCHKFAWHLQKEGNFVGAENFYKVACQKGYKKSCNNLGFIAEKSGDLHKASNYYSWGCIKGHGSSCKNIKRVNKELRQAH